MATAPFRIGRPNRELLELAMWRFYCAVWCDQQEKWGTSREQGAKEYEAMRPRPISLEREEEIKLSLVRRED